MLAKNAAGMTVQRSQLTARRRGSCRPWRASAGSPPPQAGCPVCLPAAAWALSQQPRAPWLVPPASGQAAAAAAAAAGGLVSMPAGGAACLGSRQRGRCCMPAGCKALRPAARCWGCSQQLHWARLQRHSQPARRRRCRALGCASHRCRGCSGARRWPGRLRAAAGAPCCRAVAIVSRRVVFLITGQQTHVLHLASAAAIGVCHSLRCNQFGAWQRSPPEGLPL